MCKCVEKKKPTKLHGTANVKGDFCHWCWNASKQINLYYFRAGWANKTRILPIQMRWKSKYALKFGAWKFGSTHGFSYSFWLCIIVRGGARARHRHCWNEKLNVLNNSWKTTSEKKNQHRIESHQSWWKLGELVQNSEYLVATRFSESTWMAHSDKRQFHWATLSLYMYFAATKFKWNFHRWSRYFDGTWR